MIVFNKEDHDLTCDFKGNTYTIPKLGFINIPDDLYEHLKELWPLSLNFEPKVGKNDPIIEVAVKQTESKYPGGNFGIKTQNLIKKVDDIPNGGDKDGVVWYGEGLQNDTP